MTDNSQKRVNHGAWSLLFFFVAGQAEAAIKLPSAEASKWAHMHARPQKNTVVRSSFLACNCNSRLRSAIRRHHSPQKAVLNQICCFGERKMVMFQILLDGAEPRDAGTT